MSARKATLIELRFEQFLRLREQGKLYILPQSGVKVPINLASDKMISQTINRLTRQNTEYDETAL